MKIPNIIRSIFLILPLLAVFTQHSQAQEGGYYDDDYLRYDDHIYRDSIVTVQLFRKGWKDGFPILNLRGDNQLLMSFEDLSGLVENFAYEIIHCNADWQPSQLRRMEFMRGMNEIFIENYRYSGNTREQFIRYEFAFPNDNLEILKSGNYILRVFDTDNDKTLITRRFLVFEDLVDVEMDIKRATKARYRETHHEVDFTLHEKRYKLVNPYTNLKTVVMQNRRWDNAITDLEPRSLRNGKLIYDYFEENLFPGNNEFRFFDTRNLTHRAQTTERIEVYRGLNHVHLVPDEVYSTKIYLDRPDINGQYLVRNDDRRLGEIIDADYAWVHFTLPYPFPLKDGNLYIFGQLTDWKHNKSNELQYNEEKRQYEGSLYLKQGYYDYVYMYMKDGTSAGDLTLIEGNHAQAENDYAVLVYHRQNGEIYDRLVGFSSTSFPQR